MLTSSPETMFKSIKQFFDALKHDWSILLDKVTPADTYVIPEGDDSLSWKPSPSTDLQDLVGATRKQAANRLALSLVEQAEVEKATKEQIARYRAEQFAAPANERRQR